MVEDNEQQSRFELRLGEHVAFAVYRRRPGVVTIVHTEVPTEMRGQGIGSQLARGALKLVRKRGEKVEARCSFIVDFLAKNPEFKALEAP